METVQATIDPCPSVKGQSEGHGEGVSYKNRLYFYRDGKRIPKDKVTALKWEGDWAGRVKGNVEHIIVCWNGSDFTVLEHVYQGGLTKAIAPYKGLSHDAAVAIREAEIKKWHDFWNKHPKCKHCAGNTIVLADDQPKDVCLGCHKKGLK